MAGSIEAYITYDVPYSAQRAATVIRAVEQAVDENWQPKNQDEYTPEMKRRSVKARAWNEEIESPEGWDKWETSSGLAAFISWDFSFSPRSFWDAHLQLSRWGDNLTLFQAWFSVDDHTATEMLGERKAHRMESKARSNPDLKDDWEHRSEALRLRSDPPCVGAENMRFFRNIIDHALEALPVRETEGLDDDRLDWEVWRERLQEWGEEVV